MSAKEKLKIIQKILINVAIFKNNYYFCPEESKIKAREYE